MVRGGQGGSRLVEVEIDFGSGRTKARLHPNHQSLFQAPLPLRLAIDYFCPVGSTVLVAYTVVRTGSQNELTDPLSLVSQIPLPIPTRS
jgi:hypothetical protein